MTSEEPSCSPYQLNARQPAAAMRVDIVKMEDVDTGSTLSSPATPSDYDPTPRRFSSHSPELTCLHEPSTGPKRSKSSASSKGHGEKRKRSRVTQEQLVHLEQFFAEDRIPTAARRKEISDFLGMQERQTQIWFQNRRAKAKQLDTKRTPRASDEPMERPPETPPDLLIARESHLERFIHENEPITIIPCMELNIGWWRRAANGAGRADLIAYMCERRGCLTWFVQSSDRGFKIEIPFNIIVDSQFTTVNPGTAIASFFLSEPPLFYTENVVAPTGATSPVRTWQASADWTEGMQASGNLRHDLVGSVASLANLVRRFHMNSPGSGIQLVSPYGTPDEVVSQASVTPEATSGGDMCYGNGETPKLEYFGHGRRRSFSGPPILNTTPLDSGPSLPRVVTQHLDPRVGALLDPSSASSSVSSPCSQYSRGSPRSSTHPTPVTPDYPLPAFNDTSAPDAQYQYLSQHAYHRLSPRVVSPVPCNDDPETNSFFVEKGGPYDPRAGLTALSSLSMDPTLPGAPPPSPPILTTSLHWTPRSLTPELGSGSLYDEPAFLEPLMAPPSDVAASPCWTSHYVQYSSGQ
ncbi:hypothetical protein NEOLEDRAFT_487279 [Neolentinus lepideus HHB14362 ss-1]|uniref:Homeobox domain-containing protein n=1 Tax=Neolentinus lepideus HHB14362 ss-1 TaxID=1314782 RepID=A0A165VN52_9AGAM|nr:hypothetical protein NEOLEDRAFT_487279 [Neolentinus lepideus HHB14362 ss-1]